MHGVQWGQVHVVNLDEYSKSSQGYQKIMIMESPSRCIQAMVAHFL